MLLSFQLLREFFYRSNRPVRHRDGHLYAAAAGARHQVRVPGLRPRTPPPTISKHSVTKGHPFTIHRWPSGELHEFQINLPKDS